MQVPNYKILKSKKGFSKKFSFRPTNYTLILQHSLPSYVFAKKNNCKIIYQTYHFYHSRFPIPPYTTKSHHNIS